MKHVILCKLAADGAEARRALRLAHLEYIERNAGSIVAGGPALDDETNPWMMSLFTHVTERRAVEAFLRDEPHAASGKVFASVEIHPWSQVLPEAAPGSLIAEIEKERSTSRR